MAFHGFEGVLGMAGYLGSDPSLLGTCLVASVAIRIPLLSTKPECLGVEENAPISEVSEPSAAAEAQGTALPYGFGPSARRVGGAGP